jgi:hypothetical protein
VKNWKDALVEDALAATLLTWVIDNPRLYERTRIWASSTLDQGLRSNKAAWDEIIEALGREHVICSILKDMVVALGAVNNASSVTASAVVDLVWPEPRSAADEAKSEVARELVTRLVAIALDELGAPRHLDAVVTTLRIAALATCPDPSVHYSLERTCAQPLATELQDEARTRIVQALVDRLWAVEVRPRLHD